jgi:hypothetical protein
MIPENGGTANALLLLCVTFLSRPRFSLVLLVLLSANISCTEVEVIYKTMQGMSTVRARIELPLVHGLSQQREAARRVRIVQQETVERPHACVS